MNAMNFKKRRLNDDVEEDTNVKALPYIPFDLTREILLRLPAKSLLRFRCLSKLFRSLSLDPGFVKSHLAMITRNDSVRSYHTKILVKADKRYELDLASICDGIRDFEAVETWLPSVLNDFQIVGSSNGLLCICRDEDAAVFLCNPTTREIKRLPKAPKTFSNYRRTKYTTYGFGFHVDDYKVVKLIGYGDNIFSRILYSLKANLWGKVYHMNKHNDSFSHGVHLNGAIHWVFTTLPEEVKKIVAFNLETEVFQEMQLPNQAEENCIHQFKNFVVGIVNGRLCLIHSCTDEDYCLHNDIWVMNVYGDQTSWYRIDMNLVYTNMETWCSTKKNEEVLLEVNGALILYNFKTNTYIDTLRIRGVKLRNSAELKGNSYIESLISPHMYA